MKYIYILLAQMIREGRVEVDIPAVDMDSLREICNDRNEDFLVRIQCVLREKAMDDTAKVEQLREIMEEFGVNSLG